MLVSKGVVGCWLLGKRLFVCLFAACVCGIAFYLVGVFTVFVHVVLGVWAGLMLTLHFSAC